MVRNSIDIKGRYEMTFGTVLKMEGDATGARAEDGCPFPECFGHDEAATVPERLLENDIGLALREVDRRIWFACQQMDIEDVSE